MTSRRSFIKNSAVFAAGATMPFSAGHLQAGFKMCLNPGNIGASFDIDRLLEMAIKYRYDAISPNIPALGKLSSSQLDAYKGKMKSHNISWGSTNLPIEFRKDEESYKASMQNLEKAAKVLANAGGTRMNTWVMPTHTERTYLQNFNAHARRLGEAAKVIEQYGIRLGLEYVAQKTTMTRSKYAFVRTMAEMKELIAAIDQSNVGFVLDSFHWYCAGEDRDDIKSLTPDDIVIVDLNDARIGFTRDTQLDGKRELPLATGVIPIKEFMTALKDIGFSGPIRPEPFNQPLRDLDDEEAVRVTYNSMKKAFDLV